MRSIATIGFCLALFFAAGTNAQDLPTKIRGYKLYKTDIILTNEVGAKSKETEVAFKLAEPNITGLGLLGVTAEVAAEITSAGRSGKVDFLTFQDFSLNGVAIEIDEYSDPFEFKKGETVKLNPARVRLKTTSLAKGALKELTDPKADWAVKGTIFIFGKFKKFGFTFKRVVPVKVDMTIKNPMR